MDVRCDKCGSEYELDDTRVTTQGVNVKCTSCGHVFRVTKATAQAPTRGATTGDWMIRQSGGSVFKFKELTTLQRWIVERRVTRDDEISKTGETWKRLGDILELASFFQVAEQAAIVPQQNSTGPQPIQQSPSGRITPTKRRSALPMILAIGMVVLALITGAFLMRNTIKGMFKEKPPPVAKAPPGAELATGHITTGQRELKKDTIAAYAAAEAEFEKALQFQPSNTAALVGATFALAGAAEYSREDSTEIDNALKSAAAGKSKLAPTDLATMATELAKKQADAAARTERAFAYMKRTLEADQTLKDGLRAAARYYALTNAQEAFKSISDKATAMLADDPELNYSLGLLRKNEDTQLEAAIQSFQKVLEKESDHLGAKFRLAEIFARKNDNARALQLVVEVLAAAPDHSHALALKKKLDPPKTDAAPAEPKPAQAESFDTLISRANKARQGERSRQALELYGRALEMRPDNAEALTGLGFVYLDMDQAGNAISQFQKATASNSRYSDAYMGLAEAYRARGQKRDAVKNYQKYLDLAPDGAEANVARQALKELGQE